MPKPPQSSHSHDYDAIIIGGGHNGLTTANYLAMAGLRVCVLEQRHIVGGAAVSEEFHPGFRNSIASYVVSLLRPEVVEALELKKYGYEPIALENAFYPDSNGDYILLTSDEDANREQDLAHAEQPVIDHRDIVRKDGLTTG